MVYFGVDKILDVQETNMDSDIYLIKFERNYNFFIKNF